MTDEVSQSNRLNREYREFIEQWIHEMKVPITGIQLLCENNKSDAVVSDEQSYISVPHLRGHVNNKRLTSLILNAVDERVRIGGAGAKQTISNTKQRLRQKRKPLRYCIF